ncbi:uncharacterized protein LOC136066661 [Quercus suber]|uniref:uncharacterized protein LOC136066661 n=1 Tax=Quercus suber TaxID=58331 RepID=UPI0032DFC6D6
MTTMISSASFGTKLTFLIQFGHAQKMLSNMLHPPPSLDTAVNELVREEARLATLQAQNKFNVLAITLSVPFIEQSQQSGDSSGSSNRRKQTNKKFCNYCKRPGHTIETCYRRNKSTAAVANTEPTPPMPSISVKSQSSGSTINLSLTELQEIITQAVRMAGNASLSTALSVLPGKSQAWLFDSACCNHMTPHSSLFSKLDPAPYPLNIHIADGSTMHGNSLGFVSTSNLSVPGVFHDPRTGQELGTGPRVGHMFPMDNLHLPPVAPVSVAAVAATLGKQPALPFNNSESISNSIFELIHFDVWGPSPVTSIGGSRYFVVFIDDYSRYSWIFPMKSRSEILSIYSNFAKMVETQFSKHIKTFRSDNALEYTQYAFQALLHSYGTVYHLTCPGTSQQNGRAKRKLRHILDTIRALLLSAKVPALFWGEAALHVVHAINCIPSTVIHNQTSYERLFRSPPDYHYLRSFGFACFILLQPHEHNKLEPRSRLCCFLGYGETQKGYRCYDPVSHRLRVSRNVVFWEHRLVVELSHFRSSLTNSSVLEIFPDESPIPSTDTLDPPLDFSIQSPDIFDDSPRQVVDEQVDDELPHLEPRFPAPVSLEDPSQDIPPRQSTRVRSIPTHLLDYHCYTTLATLHEPQTYREASTDPLWQIAMKEEIDALTKNHTWDLVTLPPSQSVVGCKWIYKIKTHSDGSIERYKARLVAKGFTQEYGIDYEETFAPVARISSVRALLAVAAASKWDLFQMDVKNAFLNGDLHEEVYMQPPPGLSVETNKVSQYLSAPRSTHYAAVLRILRYLKGTLFHGLFNSAQSPLILRVFSDADWAGDPTDRRSTTDTLDPPLDFSIQSPDIFDDSPRHVVDEQVDDELPHLEPRSPAPAPPEDPPQDIPPRHSTQIAMKEEIDALTKNHTWDLMDIKNAFLNGDLHEEVYMQPLPGLSVETNKTHYAAILRILRYLKDTLFHGLFYLAQSPLVLCAFSDADWAGDPTDRRSTTGYCFLLGSSLISWRSKKQTFVARSSTEAEYRALADTTSELLWLRWLLKDLGVSTSSATPFYCDNQSAIHIAHNDVFHEQTKHIKIDCHFIRSHLVHGTLKLFSVSSKD